MAIEMVAFILLIFLVPQLQLHTQQLVFSRNLREHCAYYSVLYSFIFLVCCDRQKVGGRPLAYCFVQLYFC